MGTEFLLHGVVSGHGHPVTRLPVRRDDAIGRVVERQRKIEKKEKMVQSMRHLPNILSSLRIVGAVALLLCDVVGTTLALPSSVTTWPSSSELGWLSLLRPFVSIIPFSIVAAVAAFAAIQEVMKQEISFPSLPLLYTTLPLQSASRRRKGATNGLRP